MGSYTFRWNKPAEEVFVTGTFDDWSKSIKLDKKDGFFEKEVAFPTTDKKVYYKYVVDGNWVTDDTAPSESDEHSNTNNVLAPSVFQALSSAAPESTTAQLASKVPLESSKDDPKDTDVPGGFPETPGTEPTFSVNPIPGTGSAMNPPPGQEATTNTIESNVKLDKESYEKAGSGITGTGESDLPPVNKNTIPESSLPMGSIESNPFIQSSGPSTTTAALAADVPKEPRGVPHMVSESQAAANAPPEASASPAAVADKKDVEDELMKRVSNDKPALNPEVQKAIDSMNADPKTAVPATVTASVAKANKDPEAAANPEAVKDKAAVEAELKKEVDPVTSTTAAVPADKPADPEPTPGSGEVSPTTQTPPEGHSTSKAEADAAEAQAHSKTPLFKKDTFSAEGSEASPAAASSPVSASAEESKKKKKENRRSFFGKLKDKFK